MAQLPSDEIAGSSNSFEVLQVMEIMNKIYGHVDELQLEFLKQVNLEEPNILEIYDNNHHTNCDPIHINIWQPKDFERYHPRYLWTDAFGVINYICLYVMTNNNIYLKQSKILIDHVHKILGKNRDLQQYLKHANINHPTLGGLRIGKNHDENHSDGDGQYFHYLTKWMYALNRFSLITNIKMYNLWAIELAKSIFPHFVSTTSSTTPQMHWKMSIDLSKPLIHHQGNLDPYDGYITYRLLQESWHEDNNILSKEIEIFEQMVNDKYLHFETHDNLDVGQALWLSHWYPNEKWSQYLLNSSLACIKRLENEGEYDYPSRYRLAFREFGMMLGIKSTYESYFNYNRYDSIEWYPEMTDRQYPHQFHDYVNKWQSEKIPNLLSYWKKKGLYERDTDITPIMYCSCLLPYGWLKNFGEKLIKK